MRFVTRFTPVYYGVEMVFCRALRTVVADVCALLILTRSIGVNQKVDLWSYDSFVSCCSKKIRLGDGDAIPGWARLFFFFGRKGLVDEWTL